MVRPRKEDRAEVRDVILTLKLSPTERARLDVLCEARAAELFQLTGERIAVTASSYLRGLMERDAQARGLSGQEKPPTGRRTRKGTR